MNELNEIYDHLKGLSLCATQDEFSRDWLGRSDGYFAYLKSSGEPICLSAVGMLIGRLRSVCPTCDESSLFEERARIRLALKMAKTLYYGEWELRNLPSWARVIAV